MPALLTYAIGDVHGCYTQLRNLISHCMAHCEDNPYRLILLGDYIDRGRRSRDAVELLIDIQASNRERIVCLRGNHDDMAVTAARGGDPWVWLANGGDATLASYGVARARELPARHLDWLGALPLTYSDQWRFFVHAGIDPDLPLDAQPKETLLWIREPFLSDPRDHGRLIVHGHTPSEDGAPELRPNRLNLDTGACYGGPLTAAVFDESAAEPLAFITDRGSIVPAEFLFIGR
jgi:serine/threonine protein phosphatase 1